MKLLFFQILLFMSIELNQKNYKVIVGYKAIELRDENSTAFIEIIEFNKCQVYKLKDSSYLVMPVNPFYNSIIIYKKSTLEKFVKNETFPIESELSSFYYKNKQKIDKFIDAKESLKIRLTEYINQKGVSTQKETNFNEIDRIFSFLKKNKKLTTYRLEFIAYLGDFIIQNSISLSFEWALLKDKQMLNPNVSIILFNKTKDRYFNLEEAIFGKYGYLGSENIAKNASIHLIKENPIQQVLLFGK